MAGFAQRNARGREAAAGKAARSNATSPPPAPGDYQAKITANLTGGAYEVTVYSTTGAPIVEDELAFAFPATASSLAVDSFVWVKYLSGNSKAIIDATSVAIGGGSGSGAEIVVGAPGFLSGT